MFYYENSYDNGAVCVKVKSRKDAIQEFLNCHISGDLQPEIEPFEYLTEKEVADILQRKPDEENEKEFDRYNVLKEYAECDSDEPLYPVCLVGYPEGEYEAWTPDEDGIIDWWETLLVAWAKWSAEFRERPYFFGATGAAEEVENALENGEEEKAEAIIKTVFDVGKEYQTRAIVSCLKLREELEEWEEGDDLPDKLSDGSIQTLCEFAGVDCPKIEAVEGEENELYYTCLKAIRGAFHALNWTFGTTF